MLEKIECAGAHQLNRAVELRVAADHHDSERKRSAIDLIDQSPQPDAREIDRRKNTSGGHCGDLLEELRGALVNLHRNGFAGQRRQDAVALAR